MAYSVRIVLRKYKPNSMGYHILQLCVTKNSSRKRISLKLYVDPAYWDNSAERLTIERNLKGEKQREANKKRIQDNAFLDKVKARAREIIEKFEIDGIDWTLNQFEETFLNPSKQGKFCAYLESHIQTLRDTGHTGNAKCYFETLRLLKYYDGKLNQRLFSDIDLRYVRNFDTFLQKRGCKGNTRKYYFKALRAILNQAKREGVGSEAAYPFVKGGFEIAKLEETLPPASRLAKTQRYARTESTERIRPATLSFFLLLLRNVVRRYGLPYDRSYSTAGRRELYRLQTQQNQAPKERNCHPNPHYAGDSGIDRTAEICLAYCRKLFVTDHHLFRLYRREAIQPHPKPLRQISEIFEIVGRRTRHRLSFDKLCKPSYNGNDFAIQ